MKIKFNKNLLLEKMKDVEDLPDFVFIKVEYSDSSVPDGIKISYVDKNQNELDPLKNYPVSTKGDDLPCGAIDIAPSRSLHNYDPKNIAKGVWEVFQAGTWQGYGPLLYDIAIEIASSKGIGLTADRHLVSSFAKKIWYYYMNNRSDVKYYQLDNRNNQLTPIEDDNIIQSSAEKDNKEDWTKSPLSKVFRKDNTNAINKLKQYKKIFWNI